MHKDQVLETIIALTAKQLNLNPADIKPADGIMELGSDSLMMIGLVREFEKSFNVKIKLRELFEEINSFNDLAEVILSRSPVASAAPQTTPEPKKEVPVEPIVSPPLAAEKNVPHEMNHKLEALQKQLAEIEKMSSLIKDQMLQLTQPDKNEIPAAVKKENKEAFIHEVMQRYMAKTKKSKEIASRYIPYLADSRSAVGFRLEHKEVVYPLAAKKGKGAYIEDVDGNRLLDLTMGFGILLFGHEPDFLVQRIQERLKEGILLGPRHGDTGRAAELLCKITGFDRVAFATNGTEANSAAVRLARGFTGRDKIVIFRGSYHGHLDMFWGQTISTSPLTTIPSVRGSPESMLQDTIVLDYGDDKSLEVIEALAEQIAVVIVEPVQSRNPSNQPKEFVRTLRELTKNKGILLMFDEMLTGFRVHPRGVAGLWDIKPDLVTYGKMLGGGLPLGAIAGRADILGLIDGGVWQFGDNSGPTEETIFFGGTHMQHPLVMSLTLAVLEYIEANSPNLQNALNEKTERLANEINAFCKEHDYPMKISYFGSQFIFEGAANMEVFYDLLNLEGIYIWEWRKCYLSTAHSNNDIDFIINAIKKSLNTMAEHGVIKKKIDVKRLSEVEQTRSPKFSIYFFGTYPETTNTQQSYQFVIASAKYADENQFDGIWIPERHFHPFGGIFPNPVILASALARETKQIRIGAGSVVLPLHNPIRVVEEWSVVDNLSGGRVQLGFASGWHSNDFVFNPSYYGRHKEIMFEGIGTFRQLWRGETLRVLAGSQKEIDIRTFPRPIQAMPPLAIAVVGNPESYQMAGKYGLGIITNLLAQSVEDLAKNIQLYHDALTQAGKREDARVIVLLHTYLLKNAEQAKAEAFKPLCNYLKSSLHLIGGALNSLGFKVDLQTCSAEDLDYMLEKAYQNYTQGRSLIGSLEEGRALVDQLMQIGVTEIGCFIDFGIAPDKVYAALPFINELKKSYAIPTKKKKSPIIEGPASYGQEGIWLTENRLPEPSNIHTEMAALDLRGHLDIERLKSALEKILKRHPILAATFHAESEGLRLVQEDPTLAWEVIDCSKENRAEVLQKYSTLATTRIFNLETGPLFFVQLLKFAPEHYVLIFSIHHIIFDAISSANLANELAILYENKESQLPTLPITYLDYTKQERNEAKEGKYYADIAYWRETLKEKITPLELPYDYPRPLVVSGKGQAYIAKIDSDLTSEIKTYCKTHRITVFTYLLAVLSLALKYFTGQNNILYATPLAGRTEETENLIGYFLKLIPLSIFIDENLSFSEWTKQIQSTLLDAQEHGNVPFNFIVEALRSICDDDCSLFQIVIEYENQPPFAFNVSGIEVTPIPIPVNKAQADLTLYFVNLPDGIQYTVAYSIEAFKESTVKKIMQKFEELLANTLQKKESKIKEIIPNKQDQEKIPLSEAEQKKILIDWNATDTEYPTHVSVVQRFEEQVATYPEGIAVKLHDEELTYDALNRKANQLARIIRDYAGESLKDIPIGICVERGFDMVVGILGILKAGAAYVPIDPFYPQERVKTILEEMKSPLVLSVRHIITKHKNDAPTPWVALDEINYSDYADTNLELTISPTDLAYIIFTSGTTGKPKGVAIEHHSILRTVCATNYISFSPSHRVSQICNFSFDGAIFEIWGALLNSAQLVIFPQDEMLQIDLFVENLKQYKIDIMFIPTRFFNQVVEFDNAAFSNLTYLIIGGEALSVMHVNLLMEKECKPQFVINGYGPTENTAFSTYYIINHKILEDSVPIGKPLSNTKVYVLNEQGKPAGIGEKGELYVGGAGLARGYFNRPELTAERFVINSFVTAQDEAKGYNHLYKTGDLVCWQADGILDYMGRNDFQVKIRGYRIELPEIENALLKHPDITQDCVIVREMKNDKYLVAYYVAKDPIPSKKLIRFLAGHLPDFMIPHSFVHLYEMPLTRNGKLDRKALEKKGLESQHARPHDQLERQLSAIWKECLKIDEIGVQADFFQIGGNSFLATKIINLAAKRGIKLNLNDIFRLRTIEEIARAIKPPRLTESKKVQHNLLTYEPIITLGPSEEVPLILLPPGQGGSESYLATLCSRLLNKRIVLIDNYLLKQNGETEFANFRKLTIFYIEMLYQYGIIQMLPDQKCYLGGWSMGGILAYDMMYELNKRNITVLDNFLFDPIIPMLINEKIKIPLVDKLFENYVLPKSANKITLFRCTKPLSDPLSNLVITTPYLGFDKINSNIKEILLNCDHYAIFSDENCLDKIVAELNSAIKSK